MGFWFNESAIKGHHMKEQALPFDVAMMRKDFPLLHQDVNGYPLIYLDNAATTQKPQAVIDAIAHYYGHDNANVHRGVHALSVRATLQFEEVRKKIQRFIHAPSTVECIFVGGTTAGINLVADCFVKPRVGVGDEILITHLEHHSNIVPWQMICQKTGATLQVAPINEQGEVILEAFAAKLSNKTKFVSITHASNAIGTINPIKEMIKMAHDCGAYVLIDGAQAAPHLTIDVQAFDCDFYTFSAHKVYGPTGIGVLWARQALLESMPPYQGGGDMINYVSFESTEYAPLPYKFEAGTPNIAGVIGFGVALDYVANLDLEAIAAYEAYLLNYASNALPKVDGFRIIGEAQHKVPILTFIHPRIHAHDIGTILDNEGIAVRSGHHCAMPLMDFYDVSSTSRMSFAFYNTTAEIDRCMQVLHKAKEIFA